MLERREWEVGSRDEAGEQAAGGKGENKNYLFPLFSLLPAPLPLPNSQLHTNILKEFEYLVHQFGIS